MAKGTLFDLGDPVKKCWQCKERKPLDEFPFFTDRYGKRRYSSPCKKCIRKRSRNPEAIMRKKAYQKTYLQSDQGRRSIKAINARKFGITLEDFERMQAQQGNLCAICGEPEKKKDWRTGQVTHLSIDHHHASKKVRELLCNCCNQLIGLAGENPEKLRAAAAYLEKHATVS